MLEKFHDQGISVITVDRILEGTLFDGICIDDEQAAFELVNYMIKQGRRRIIYMGPNRGISVAKGRFAGYSKALKANGIDFNPKWHLSCDVHAGQAEDVLTKAIDNKIQLDAVLCVGGLIAFGAGRALLTHNYRIPEEVMIAEFGDNDIVSRLGVSFVTVNQSPYEMGKRAIDLLLTSENKRKSGKKQQRFIIGSKIILRQTGIGHDIVIYEGENGKNVFKINDD